MDVLKLFEKHKLGKAHAICWHCSYIWIQCTAIYWHVL